MLITADHGNAEMMLDVATGPAAHRAHAEPRSAASTSAGRQRSRRAERSQDIAPTLLRMMGLPQPAEMTGRPLVAFD